MRGRLALLATIGVALTVAVLPAAALAASPARVQIEPAEQTPTGFRLKAKVNPEGSATTYYFIYKQPGEVECEDLEGCGPSTPLGGPLTGDTQQEVQAEVTGLTPGTNYIYWLIARNAFSEDVRSASLGFTTPPASAPVIESTNAWNLTPNDATVGAQINPEGLAHGVYYQFQVVANTSEYLPEIVCSENEIEPLEVDGCMGSRVPYALPIREVSGAAGKFVSLDLEKAGMTLKPDTTYHYRVLVAKRVQSEDGVDWQAPFVEGADQTFTTPPAPAIESTSVSNVTEHDATLEAQINTEGLETSYQFRLSAICGGKGACLVVVHYPLPSGLLLGSFVDQSVNLDLNAAGVTLQPGGTYTYSLSATSASGTTESAPHNFTTPENMVQPLSATTSPLSGSGQPAGSDTNTGGQPAGSGSSSSPPAPSIGVLGAHTRKTIELKPLTNAQKLAKALEVCDKKLKKQRASCKKQAEKKYAAARRRAR